MLTRAAAVVVSVLAFGCGGSALPSDDEIWHAASLRPTVILADSESERAVLGRMGTLPVDEAVAVGDDVFVASSTYEAASGRRCRRLTQQGDGTRTRLACRDGDAWVFVPDVFGGPRTALDEAPETP